MSWSVSACGPASQIAEQLEQQFERIKLNDAGEQETVQKIRAVIAQTIGTIDPAKPMNITASGSMGYNKWGWGDGGTKVSQGPYQSVDLKISPIHFTT